MARAYNEEQRIHMACEAQSDKLLPPSREKVESGTAKMKAAARKYFE